MGQCLLAETVENKGQALPHACLKGQATGGPFSGHCYLLQTIGAVCWALVVRGFSLLPTNSTPHPL